MSQNLDTVNYLKIIDRVHRFTHYADHGEWNKLHGLMANSIWIDYFDLDQKAPERVDLGALISSWKEQMAGFEAVQHILSNHCVDFYGQHRASCRAYARIYRTLPNKKGGSFWHLGGTYDFGLAFQEDVWRIERITWKTLWSEGNSNIFELAFEKGQELLASKPLTTESSNP